jgi:hypothetical protein
MCVVNQENKKKIEELIGSRFAFVPVMLLKIRESGLCLFVLRQNDLHSDY